MTTPLLYAREFVVLHMRMSVLAMQLLLRVLQEMCRVLSRFQFPCCKYSVGCYPLKLATVALVALDVTREFM